MRLATTLSVAVVVAACAGSPESASPGQPSAATVAPAGSASPGPTATTVAPAVSSPSDQTLLITCDSSAFPVEVFDRQPTDELEIHPSATALRTVLTRYPSPEYSASGWWLATRDASSAHYVQGSGPVYVYFLIEAEGSVWGWNGRYGECTLAPDLVGHDPVTWTVDPSAQEPAADSTQIHLLITEAGCVGGRPIGDRLLDPAIVYEPDGVFVALAAVQMEEPQDCPANVPEAVTVQLREPLGGRALRGWVPPPTDSGG